MSEANENGPDIAVEIHASPEGAGEGGDGGQVVEAAAVEPVAEAAVEVARIEADRDVTIAAIEADASIEHRELSIEENRVFAEGLANSELEQCRTKIAELETANSLLTAEVARLTPPPSEEPPPSLQVEVEGAENVEVVGPRENQEPAPEPEKPKRKPHRWI